MATMSDQQSRTLKDQFMLRLPDGMRDRIKASADANNRSMNAEIVETLEARYPSGPDIDALARFVRSAIPEGVSEAAALELADDILPQLIEAFRIMKQMASEAAEDPTNARYAHFLVPTPDKRKKTS